MFGLTKDVNCCTLFNKLNQISEGKRWQLAKKLIFLLLKDKANVCVWTVGTIALIESMLSHFRLGTQCALRSNYLIQSIRILFSMVLFVVHCAFKTPLYNCEINFSFFFPNFVLFWEQSTMLYLLMFRNREVQR